VAGNRLVRPTVDVRETVFREVSYVLCGVEDAEGYILAFIDDEALSRGAAIAFYTVTSIAPVLLIVIAIAGLVLGRNAAQNALTGRLTGLVGQQTADVLQTAIASASSKSSGTIATIIDVITLIVTASGVFGEMQTSLNAIWKAEPKGITVSRLIRARAASLGLVAALGFLLMVSLVVSSGLSVRQLPRLHSCIRKNHLDLIIVSLALISFSFAASIRSCRTEIRLALVMIVTAMSISAIAVSCGATSYVLLLSSS